ncbi:MAG: hypothetical protein OSB41_02855 [Kiritimatiellae bacterium]|nr:hypothetical protein [Kiritimatiellia bacterium]
MASASYLLTSGFDTNDAPQVHPAYKDERHLVDLALIYRVSERVSTKLVIQNAFGDDVPPATFDLNAPTQGNLGSDETRAYLSGTVTF